MVRSLQCWIEMSGCRNVVLINLCPFIFASIFNLININIIYKNVKIYMLLCIYWKDCAYIFKYKYTPSWIYIYIYYIQWYIFNRNSLIEIVNWNESILFFNICLFNSMWLDNKKFMPSWNILHFSNKN